MDIIKDKDNEGRRVAELRKYNILDTLKEEDYDDITFLASLICGAPISLISFVDEKREWIKSHKGFAIREILKENSFCTQILHSSNEMLIVPDSRKDDRFHNNPLVTGYPNIVFYAGILLVNAAGFNLGAICVIDIKPRELTKEQLSGLKILAFQVMNLLELKKINLEKQLIKLQLETRNKDLEQFAMVVSHDIKSPLTSAILSNQILKEDYGVILGKEGMELLEISSKSTAKINNLVDNILAYYRGGINSEVIETFNLTEFLDALNQIITSPKKYVIHYDISASVVCMNKTQLEQIFFNLINNSIRYNDKPVTEIEIDFFEDADYYYFAVKDNGIGIAIENRDKVFNLFSTVSTMDQFGIKGSGIGLPTVKKIIENHSGTIEIESEMGVGTRIAFKIKKLTNINDM